MLEEQVVLTWTFLSLYMQPPTADSRPNMNNLSGRTPVPVFVQCPAYT